FKINSWSYAMITCSNGPFAIRNAVVTASIVAATVIATVPPAYTTENGKTPSYVLAARTSGLSSYSERPNRQGITQDSQMVSDPKSPTPGDQGDNQGSQTPGDQGDLGAVQEVSAFQATAERLPVLFASIG